MQVFKSLCARINDLIKWFDARNTDLKIINAGVVLELIMKIPANFPFSANISEFSGI
jgi:hypothetical protein